MSFAFFEAPGEIRSEATPRRPARELVIGELSAEQPADWSVDDVVFGAAPQAQLHKCTLPESQAPSALCAELADLGAPQAEAALASTDLVTDVYEGGFKLWECARDLLEVLHDTLHRGELKLDGAAVLEAGCGVGLPGAYALQGGASRLVLQDFNAAVLRLVTAPTLRLNGLWPRLEAGDVRLLSGDWADVSALLSAERRDATRGREKGEGKESVGEEGEGKEGDGDAARGDGAYDLILSADTIYNAEATRRLWKLVSEQLRDGGVAYIAAKSYYFGVGGSVADLLALVTADGRFDCRTVRTFEDGASNRREVLELRWRQTCRRAESSPRREPGSCRPDADAGGGAPR